LQQHAETDADLTIATIDCPVDSASDFGVVEVDWNLKITGFEEKPLNPQPIPSRSSMALVSMGVYVFKKKVLLESLQDACETCQGYDFGRDVIPPLIRGGRTYAFNFRNDAKDSPRYWRDIGTVDGYYQASMDLVHPDAPFDPYANDAWPSQPTRHPYFSKNGRASPSLCRNDGTCVARSVLSPDIEVAARVTVDESVLMPGVRLGKGARLRRTIVEEGVHIPAGFQAGFDLDQDRQYHTITDAGVVVVSKTPVARHNMATR
jgi:glucose-1-phosphate adenylyltransferase